MDGRYVYDHELLTPTEVKEELGLGKNRVYELLNSKSLKAMRLGRRWLIPRVAFDEFVRREAGL